MNQYWATWNIRTTHFRTLQSAVILVCLSSHGCISIPLQWELRVTTVLPLCKFETFVYSLPMASHGHRYFPGSLSFPSVFWVILGTPGAARSIWRTSAALPAVLAASAISSLCSGSRSDVSGFGPVGCMAAGVGSTWGVLTDKSSSNGRQLGCEMFPLFFFLLAKRYCWWSSFF